ncbi:MAG: hypothetical protein ACEQSR_03830 [Candidatus Methylacidiphilales bacterium]
MEKLALGKISVKQLDFIRKEYKFLAHTDKEKATKVQLRLERARLATFIRTIEKIFDIDFYGELLKKL